MSIELIEILRDKLIRGELPTYSEFSDLMMAFDMLIYENDFLHTDHRILSEDVQTLKEQCVRSNPALDFEISSKWGNKTEN
jgi:hypothetical protein